MERPAPCTFSGESGICNLVPGPRVRRCPIPRHNGGRVVVSRDTECCGTAGNPADAAAFDCSGRVLSCPARTERGKILSFLAHECVHCCSNIFTAPQACCVHFPLKLLCVLDVCRVRPCVHVCVVTVCVCVHRCTSFSSCLSAQAGLGFTGRIHHGCLCLCSLLLADPNGPFYDPVHKLHHLMYQYRTPRVWGHAVSQDLLHWTQLPVALENDMWYDQGGVYTGSTTLLNGTEPAILYAVSTNDMQV